MAVREIKPGVFDVVVYDKRRPDGTRPRKTKRVKGTQDDARAVERKLTDEREAGKPIGPTDTLAAYVGSYLEYRAADLQGYTRQNYRRAADRYVLPTLGRLKIGDIRPNDVRAMLAKLAKDKLANSTRLYAFRILRMVLDQAVKDREILFNPCDAVKTPKTDASEPQALEPEEVLELLRHLRGTPVFAPAFLAFDTGIRREEFLALRWSDVDLNARTATIQRAVEQAEGEVRVKEPKTARSKRVVSLSAPMVEVLKEHRAHHQRERLTWGRFWRDEGLVFPSPVYHDQERPLGRLWTPYAFAAAWRRAMVQVNEKRLAEHVKAGGRPEDFMPWKFGPHRLRHTFVTYALSEGVRLEIVSRAAGHSNANTTLRVYSHVLRDEHAETAVATGRLLEKLGGAT